MQYQHRRQAIHNQRQPKEEISQSCAIWQTFRFRSIKPLSANWIYARKWIVYKVLHPSGQGIYFPPPVAWQKLVGFIWETLTVHSVLVAAGCFVTGGDPMTP